MGRLLWVNLTDRTVRDEPLDEELARQFVGGFGLAARLTFDRMPAKADPLGPDNILGFMTGPLTGTPCIEGNRYVVTCKSPLTGTWGEGNGGGRFGPHLKFAGYDGVFVTGQAAEPVYLFINNGHAELRSAAHLWGKDSNQTESDLQSELGKETQVACIGQAGEGLSLISGVMNDGGRAAARSGVGAVMGSKRLKAIAVQGKLEVPLADAEGAKALRRKYMEQKNPAHGLFTTTGTMGVCAPSSMSGDSPVKNWGGVPQTDFPRGLEVFNGEKLLGYQTRKYGCWQCTMACGGHVEVKDGPYKVKAHKPEYENGAAFGTICLNENWESILMLNHLSNLYGFDAISAGATIAFALECYENGLITKADTGGLELTWGNHAAMVELLKLMGERKGIGDVLADGVRKAAERIGKGAEAYAVHVHGQELPMHDPRHNPSWSVIYHMDASPGKHMHGNYNPGLAPLGVAGPPPKGQQTGRGPVIRQLTALSHVVNSAGVCLFGYSAYSASFIPDFLTAVTGEAWDLQRWERTGERIANMRHAFNLREGLNPLEWAVPGRMIGNPPLSAGPHKDVQLDHTMMVQEYLAAMDWDTRTARPSADRLRSLGLGDLVETVGHQA